MIFENFEIALGQFIPNRPPKHVITSTYWEKSSSDAVLEIFEFSKTAIIYLTLKKLQRSSPPE